MTRASSRAASLSSLAADLEIGALVLQGQRDRAATSSDVEHARPGAEREGGLDQQLGLRTRHEHAPIDGEVQPTEAATPNDIGDRLALDRAAAHRVLKRADGRSVYDQPSIEEQLLARHTEHAREQQLGIQARRLASRGADRGDRAVERVEGGRAGRVQGRPQGS